MDVHIRRTGRPHRIRTKLSSRRSQGVPVYSILTATPDGLPCLLGLSLRILLGPRWLHGVESLLLVRLGLDVGAGRHGKDQILVERYARWSARPQCSSAVFPPPNQGPAPDFDGRTGAVNVGQYFPP